MDVQKCLNDIALKYIERNFGGLPSSDFKKYFPNEKDNIMKIDLFWMN